MGDEDRVLQAVTALHTEISTGFNRVYDEIGKVEGRVTAFGTDLLTHQLACTVRFGNLEAQSKFIARDLEAKHAEEVREEKATEKGIAEDLKKRINWGTVKTSLTVLVLGVVLIAALKILFLNHDQIGQVIK